MNHTNCGRKRNSLKLRTQLNDLFFQHSRFNMNDRAVFNNIPQQEMMKFYTHYKALAAEIQRDDNEWRFKLEPGTICIFDNWRLLHGRTEYSGHRQMVGCYVARSEFMSVARQHGLVE